MGQETARPEQTQAEIPQEPQALDTNIGGERSEGQRGRWSEPTVVLAVLTVVLTAVIAIATAVYAGYTYSLLQTTREYVEVTKRYADITWMTFQASNSPYIGIENQEYRYDEEEKRGSVKFHVKNFGSTPAFNVNIMPYWSVNEEEGKPTTVVGLEGIILFPNSSHTVVSGFSEYIYSKIFHEKVSLKVDISYEGLGRQTYHICQIIQYFPNIREVVGVSGTIGQPCSPTNR